MDQLTPGQQATLKSFVEADVVLNAIPHTLDGAFAVADALNQVASPEFTVWRSSVTQDEIMQNGFDWLRVDNLSTGAARIWEWMFQNEQRAVDPSKLNVRAGIEAVWKGTAADLAVRAAVYEHCKRASTVAEKLFATGTGTVESPATAALVGDITYSQVHQAMQW